jgi:hypothetical protein
MSSNNKFEVLRNLDGSVNLEDTKKEVEEEHIMDINPKIDHPDIGTKPCWGIGWNMT